MRERRWTTLSIRCGADKRDADDQANADTLKGAGQPGPTSDARGWGDANASEAAPPIPPVVRLITAASRRRPPRFGVHVRGPTGSTDSGRRRSCNARHPAECEPFVTARVSDPFSSPNKERPTAFRCYGAECVARAPIREIPMANKMLIDATHPEETRVVVMRGNRDEEFDFESAQRKQLRGNIYLAKVTRVEPSLQAAFVEYGGNRHGFLAFSEIHPDYYQI